MALLILILAIGPLVWGQTPAGGSVKGVVLNSVTGEPVSKALVTLRGRLLYSASVRADGTFEFKGLDAGTYVAAADRTGFVALGRDPRTVTITSGESSSIKLILAPQAVIAGRVTDSDGEPFQGVQVQVLKRSWTGDQKLMVPAGTAVTDDRGEYRIPGLSSGSYYVVAKPSLYDRANLGLIRQISSDAAQETYPSSYFPGVADGAHATRVEVRAGAVRQGIDFQMWKTLARRVSGRLLVEPENPGGRMQLSLVSEGSFQPIWIRTMSLYDGTFQFLTVLPGHYDLVANTNEAYVSMPIDVGDANIADVVATLKPLMTMSGRIQWDGEAPSQNPHKVSVQLQPVSGIGFPSGSLGEEAFQLARLMPGKMLVSVRHNVEDYVQSIRYGNRTIENDVVEVVEGAELEIVMKRGAGVLEGTVQNGDDPAANSTVLLIPAAESSKGAHSLYKQAVSDQTGHFQIRGIPPGEYDLYALESIEPGSWFEPEFATEYSRYARRIKIEEKARESQTINLIRKGK